MAVGEHCHRPDRVWVVARDGGDLGHGGEARGERHFQDHHEQITVKEPPRTTYFAGKRSRTALIRTVTAVTPPPKIGNGDVTAVTPPLMIVNGDVTAVTSPVKFLLVALPP